MTPEQEAAIRARDATAELVGEPIDPPEGVVFTDSCVMRAYDRRMLLAALDEARAMALYDATGRDTTELRAVLALEEEAHVLADAEWRKAIADADALAEAIAEFLTTDHRAVIRTRAVLHRALDAHEAGS